MRYDQIITERRLNLPDEQRLELLHFIWKWLCGSLMQDSSDFLPHWQKVHDLFPTRISRPISLMRLVTLPIEYADKKVFPLDNPAPKSVGSWTSTHFGLESVHGIATEFGDPEGTCRIAIKAQIAPENILASYQTLRRAFMTLAHDFDYDKFHVDTVTKEKGMQVHRTTVLPYLGSNDEAFIDDIDYYKSVFNDMKGGPLRQYEYIVRTTPLTVQNIRVYRRGGETYFNGHDDPHNSDSFRGWFKD